MASGTGICSEASLFVAGSAADQGRMIHGQIREQAGEIKTQDKHQPEDRLAFGGPAWPAMPKGQGSKEYRGNKIVAKAIRHHLEQKEQERLIIVSICTISCT